MRRARLALAALALVVVAAPVRPLAAQLAQECQAGDREVGRLNFEGNRAFSDGDLALRVSTTASSWLRRRLGVGGTRRCLDSAELKKDVVRLFTLYHDAGYYDAVVDTAVTALGAGRVAVTFRIREGQPVRVRVATIAGLEAVPEREQVLRGLWLAVGKPYDVVRLATDVDSIIARLRNTGYPRADVLRNTEVRRDSLLARVRLDVVPGPRAHIGTVDVVVVPVDGGRGRQQVPSRIVRRLMGVGSGDLYRDRDLLRAQRNIYSTGAYQHVELAVASDSLRPGGDSVVDLRVLLREDYMRQLDLEPGWATLDCFRVRAQLTDKNFLHTARRLEVTGQVSKIAWAYPLRTTTTRRLCRGDQLRQDPPEFSDTLNYSVAATLRQPTLFGTWATPAFSIYRELRREFKAYLRNTLIGGEASLTRALEDGSSLRLGYNLEYGSTRAQPALLCALFSRCDPESRRQAERTRPLAVASALGVRVRTDNTVSPTRGYVARGEVRGSGAVLGSAPALSFGKGVLDAAWYHPLGWGNVLAVRVRGGLVAGGEASPGTGARLPPPQERLYAGGASSVRGFQQNELGALLYIVHQAQFTKTSDTTGYYSAVPGRDPQRIVPTGGNSLAVANIDYRVRSPLFPELLQFTLFTDGGAVWTRETDQLRGLGLRGQKFYWTPGLGVRVFSPVGPIQVNVGYNPYARPPGAAFYSSGVEASGFAPLYCVSPSTAGGTPPPVHLVDGQWLPVEGQPCAATYQPPRHNNYLRKLTFTFSIGPEF